MPLMLAGKMPARTGKMPALPPERALVILAEQWNKSNCG
jgi:hypothetical protein